MLHNAKKYVSRTTPRGVQHYFCSGCGGIFSRVRSIMNFSFVNSPDKKVRFDGYCQDCLSQIDYEGERQKVIKASWKGERYICRL